MTETRSIAQIVGANIRAEMARSTPEWMQADVASAISRGQSTTGKRLRGEIDLSVTELAKIAALLQVPISTLLAGVEEFQQAA